MYEAIRYSVNCLDTFGQNYDAGGCCILSIQQLAQSILSVVAEKNIPQFLDQFRTLIVGPDRDSEPV